MTVERANQVLAPVLNATGRAAKHGYPVERAVLDYLPPAKQRGARHLPIPHNTLVSTLLAESEKRGLKVSQESYTLAGKGTRLFGLFTFEQRSISADLEQRWQLGFRHGNDGSMSVRIAVGRHVMVCSNGCFSGDEDVLKRKHTSGLHLEAEVSGAFDRYLTAQETLDERLKALAGTPCTDEQAKAKLLDCFVHHDSLAPIAPMRLLPEAHKYYFGSGDGLRTSDCAPRTMWGLHNAVTRALRVLPPPAATLASRKLGQRFGL
jgi:hypothetical protein